MAGGGGGGANGGGGGAGGLLTGTNSSLQLNASYNITIGAGGTGASYPGRSSITSGSSSTFSSITSI
ncbi:MAG: hypothetical protein EBU90_29790 [Proteobacteria bacterium]|nr:hypothetical protein [Pseudomonadota bacterium]